MGTHLATASWGGKGSPLRGLGGHLGKFYYLQILCFPLMGNFRTISWGFVQIKTNGEPDSWLRSGYCETQRDTESRVRRAAWAQKELSGQEQRDPSQDTGYMKAVAAQTKPLQEILIKKTPTIPGLGLILQAPCSGSSHCASAGACCLFGSAHPGCSHTPFSLL